MRRKYAENKAEERNRDGPEELHACHRLYRRGVSARAAFASDREMALKSYAKKSVSRRNL
jgi:hypothetical protein